MSHFAEVKCAFKAEFKDEFIASLEAEFGAGTVEFNEEGADMFGYHGDNRSKISPKSPDWSPRCEIIIRRKHIGSASNDIGFKFQPDGSIKGYISDFDKGATFNKKRQDAVAVDYQLRVGEKMMLAKGVTSIERIKLDNGGIRLVGKMDSVAKQATKIEVKGF